MQMGAAAAGWEAGLRACAGGAGSPGMLGALCAELAASVRLWLDLRLAQSPVSPTLLARAMRAVQVGRSLFWLTFVCLSSNQKSAMPAILLLLIGMCKRCKEAQHLCRPHDDM
jgi:hypothetical protein